MANRQMTSAIRAATERVMAYGYRDHQKVTDRDVMLAGFGHVAEQLADRTFVLKLEGKKSFALGGVLGGLIVGIIPALQLVV